MYVEVLASWINSRLQRDNLVLDKVCKASDVAEILTALEQLLKTEPDPNIMLAVSMFWGEELENGHVTIKLPRNGRGGRNV